ncbi:MAG: DCC1-like thiol-disulfide oxidoreductase family protein [Anaerolineae bacterium]
MVLVQRLDRHQRVHIVPFQQPGVLTDAGLTVAQAEGAAWVVDGRGRRYRGAAAINAALAAALGWPWLLSAYFWPGVMGVEDAVYAWVARNRSHFPGLTPYCDRPGAHCGPLSDAPIARRDE